MGPWWGGAIAGITIDPHYVPQCNDWVAMDADDYDRYPLPVPGDLPEDWAIEEPTGWLCGSLPLAVERVIRFDNFISFGYGRHYDLRILRARAGKSLIRAGTIQGHDAIFIRPHSRQGAGNSWIAFADGDDLIIFKGADVHFSVLRRAAESLPL